MKPRPLARTRLVLTGGFLAAVLPLAGGGASPASGIVGGLAAEGEASFGGYTATASSTPILIEIFEPSIPIPVDAGVPQLEFNLGYTRIKADSGQSTGRASFFWPGDPVGEGLKTFAEQLGLPSTPLTENGYPVQVNSQFPGEPATQRDEQFPGSVQRTTSGEGTAIAKVGFSPDGDVAGPADESGGDGSGDGSGGGSGDGAANPLSGLTDQLSGLFGGGLPGTSTAAEETAPANPLAMVVDIDGYESVSKMDATSGPVTTVSRSNLGEVRLLGGLITLGGVQTTARAASDGTTGVATGKAIWGTGTIAGQEFSIGPDGAVAGGSPTPIPGLQDAPGDALKALGVSFRIPEPVRTVDGDAATTKMAGLEVTLDLSVLAPVLTALPTAQLGDLIPAEAGPLKGVVSGLANLSPRIVLTLGAAKAAVDTVPPFEFAPVAPTGEAPVASGGEVAAGGAASVPPAVDAAPAPVGAAPPVGDTPVADLVDAAPTSAGLPELFSIPGMLLVAAFVIAAVAGSWFRRLGAAALGIGGSCTHGLDSGLPDLRKA